VHPGNCSFHLSWALISEWERLYSRRCLSVAYSRSLNY